MEDVVVATLESTPANAAHWSRAKMAARNPLSKSTIGCSRKACHLKPHRAGEVTLSTDPLVVDNVYDIVELYLNHFEAAVVLWVDVRSQVQAVAPSQPAFPMMPRMPGKRTHDHVRNHTTTPFCAFTVADRTVISSLHRRRRAVVFKTFLVQIDTEAPDGLGMYLTCHNDGTREYPTGGTWVNAGRPPFSPARHPDLLRPAQPGRTALRLHHRRPTPAQRLTQRPSLRGRARGLGQQAQPFIRARSPEHIPQSHGKHRRQLTARDTCRARSAPASRLHPDSSPRSIDGE